MRPSGGWGGKGRGVQGKYCTFYELQRFSGQMPFLLPTTSAKDIHWNSSFLQPPTDSWDIAPPFNVGS